MSNHGSIDWRCLPRFDSPACFAALLGTRDHGRWLIHPVDPVCHVRRAYREGSLVLDTEFETASGVVRISDCMPMETRHPNVARLVEGVRGRVVMRMELAGPDQDDEAWAIQKALLGQAEAVRDRPDEGIWEVRGQHRRPAERFVVSGAGEQTISVFGAVAGACEKPQPPMPSAPM